MFEHCTRRVVTVVGFGQMLAWGSSYYLPAVIAVPMARSFGLPATAVFAMFSGALLVNAALNPLVGRLVDRHGGRRLLLAANGLLATALLAMAVAPIWPVLLAAWLLLGAGMAAGLYETGFAIVVRHLGLAARSGIVAVTLIAGFASTVSWPLSHLLETVYGWRTACFVWALLHLTLGLLLHGRLLPSDPRHARADATAARDDEARSALVGGIARSTRAAPAVSLAEPRVRVLMAVFAATGFVFAALAAHLPHLLERSGATPQAAIAAASLVGGCQVLGRVLEAGWLKRFHPFVAALVATALHPVGAALLLVVGAPAAVAFTALHGGGVGLMTIVKGTLPLALFGPQGFGARAGLLEAPSKLMQALAPVVFGLCIDALGTLALLLTTGLTLLAFAGFVWVARQGPLHEVHPAPVPAAGEEA